MIRTAVVGDLPSLLGVFRRSSLSNEGDRDKLLAHEELLDWSDAGIREDRTRAALSPDGAIVGFASCLIVGHVMELGDLFVDPPWMRRGVGRRLEFDAVEIARERSLDRLEVTANPHASAFYESMGFVVKGIGGHAILSGSPDAPEPIHDTTVKPAHG